MKILVYVARMPFAKPAIQYGALIARLTGASITLLHAPEKRADKRDVERVLQAAVDLLPGLDVRTQFRVDNPVTGVLDEIRGGEYDMVILRARKAIRYRQRLGQKVARIVAQESPISVLTVKGKDTKLERILICTGGKAVANVVISEGAMLAKAAGSRVTLLHVAPSLPSMYTGMDAMDEGLEAVLKSDTPLGQHLRESAQLLDEYGVDARIELKHGDVAEEILAEAESGSYDLVVIGAARDDNRLKEWLLGDVTRTIVNHANCSVLIVR
jgi:nucleotide-binding universal stress UspA family protein